MDEADKFPDPPALPEGEYAIVELFGHTTLVGRITEVERFGSKMLAIEPLFNDQMLGVVFHGGAAIYRLTPCSAEIARKHQPTESYQLPAPIRATVPQAALPPPRPQNFTGSGQASFPVSDSGVRYVDDEPRLDF